MGGSFGLLVIVLVSAALIVGIARAQGPALERKPGWFADAPATGSTTATAATTGWLTRGELEAKLQALAASTPPAPDTLNPGAMCYKPAMDSGTVDVTCSACGARTVHARGWEVRQLQSCERLIQALRKAPRPLDASFDDRFYCAACNPELAKARAAAPTTAEPESTVPPATVTLPDGSVETLDGAYVVVRFPDQAAPRRLRATPALLTAALALLQGAANVKGDADRETPLKDHLKELRALLGEAR